ncbi:MAG: hypothetical protein DRG83_00375 [Deltaproteobacteria bacterium]|nr:MAG: hypothetical protein DRG83_00375 [Deltaproteobacteria bacterium]
MKGKKFCQLVKEYTQAVKQAEEKANKIGDILTNLLRPYIPDITYTVGGADEGVETIYFWSKSWKEYLMKDQKDIKFPVFEVEDLIVGVFPELEDHIRAIVGEVEAEIADKIEQDLMKLKEQ